MGVFEEMKIKSSQETNLSKTEPWYQDLIVDLRKLAFEGIVKTKWAIGRRILDDFEKFGKPVYGSNSVEKLAVDLKVSRRDLYACVQFARQFKLCDISHNLTWYEIVHKMLPAPKQEAETLPLPTGKYRIVYADPPWEYHVGEQHGKEAQATVLATHYPSMSEADITALPVSDLAADNAVLFLWATSPCLEDALRVATGWDFEYKAMFVWDKMKHNVGHYNSVRHELLLICTKGSCTPDTKELHDSVVSIERSARHSEKPERFRELIDAMYLYPHGQRNDRVELFARRRPPKHWDAWGSALAKET